jgi:anti-sigma regulatory factor (Ser/Thr protein kinase)
MSQNLIVTILQPKDNNLGYSFQSVLDLLRQLQNIQPNDVLIIDLNKITFAYPFLFIPLNALLRKLEISGVNVSIINNHCSYLDTIRFPVGLDPLLMLDWQSEINRYQHKSYLPICAIPTADEHKSLRENLISAFEKILCNQLNLTLQMQTCISYLISEAFDNVVEHANVQNGWIMAQNYPSYNYLDVCVADTGIGLLGAYQKMGFKEIVTSEKAMYEAINGRSTKGYEQSRGYGIKTSRKMLVNGLNGTYFLVSGNAFYYSSGEQELINAFDSSYFWNGTILALRIPKTEPLGFNYVNYLE